MKKSSAQVTPFMIMVMAVLILAIAATILIGELGFNRVRLSNIGDSALITAASGFCRSLNQIRMLHSRMFLNYLQLQTALLCVIWPNKAAGTAAAVGWSLIGIEMNTSLYYQAKAITKDMSKNLRTALYDASMAGALVDEPFPFLDTGDCLDAQNNPVPCDEQDEVVIDPTTRRITRLLYDRYLERQKRDDFPFIREYRKFKRGEVPYQTTGGTDRWYQNNLLSYAFNKSADRVLTQPGELNVGEPIRGFESYLRTELLQMPRQVSISPKRMVLVFLYWVPTPTGPIILPGFLPHPCAWITRVTMDRDTFGLRLEKLFPFTRIPFFGRSVILQHRNMVRVKGSVWRGFDFVMQE